MRKTHILVVDDEAGVRDVVQRYLERDGYRVSLAATGPEALALVDRGSKSDGDRIDLLVLDVMLPGLDGLEIVKRLRVNNGVPVVMLSARSEEFDRVMGLELGADDYVAKPFSPRELVSRVKAVLRRTQPAVASEAQPLAVTGIVLHPDTRAVEVDGQTRELTAKEFELLEFFMRHPRQVFTREQLLENVWGFSDYIDASTVTVHIHRLRDKIEHDPNNPLRLQTVWGVGYRLAAEA